jgi:type IV secretory pathway TraG/TraD family ATPase VirD4
LTGSSTALWIAVQSLSQLDAVYGRVRASVLRDNMETQIYYRPSNHETASYLERALGRRSEYAHSETQREGTALTQGLSEQAVPLLTAQDIKQMRDEDTIGFHRRLPPFKATRMDWRCFPVLRQRQHIPPPALYDLPPLQTDSLKQDRLRTSYINPDSIGEDGDRIETGPDMVY